MKPFEQADHVEEAARHVLRDEHSHVLVLRIATLLDVPVLDGTDDVRLVGRAELELDLIAGVRLRVQQQQIETSGPRLPALAISHLQIAQPQ